MPVRQINIPPEVFQRIFEKVAEMFPEEMEEATRFIADEAEEFWKELAKKEPKKKDGSASKWGERYAETIISEEKEGGIKLYADESHPSFMYVDLIEEGVTVWNIKRALLNGKAARRNKAEYGTVFVRVPFRWRTPSKAEPGRGTKFAGTMPKNLYEKVKRGEKIGKEEGQFAGLVKMGGPLHSQYMTFRTVSDKSEGWFYPSKAGVPIFEKVKQRIEKLIEQAIESMVIGYLKNLAEEESK